MDKLRFNITLLSCCLRRDAAVVAFPPQFFAFNSTIKPICRPAPPYYFESP